MKHVPITDVEGAFVLQRDIYEDERGFFSEVVGRELGEELGMTFVQQNESFSNGGVLRGLHLQEVDPQGKLVTSLYGEALDVMLDLREDSPTFLKGFAFRLNWLRGESVYVPPGCAHGVLILSRFCVINYNCTSYYNRASDGGVNWLSPEVRDLFPTEISPMLSDKDLRLPYVQEYLDNRKKRD